MQTTLLIIAIAWAVSAIPGYILMRLVAKNIYPRWTVADRLSAMGYVILLGPVLLLVIALVFAFSYLEKTEWANREARW